MLSYGLSARDLATEELVHHEPAIDLDPSCSAGTKHPNRQNAETVRAMTSMSQSIAFRANCPSMDPEAQQQFRDPHDQLRSYLLGVSRTADQKR